MLTMKHILIQKLFPTIQYSTGQWGGGESKGYHTEPFVNIFSTIETFINMTYYNVFFNV